MEVTFRSSSSNLSDLRHDDQYRSGGWFYSGFLMGGFVLSSLSRHNEFSSVPHRRPFQHDLTSPVLMSTFTTLKTFSVKTEAEASVTSVYIDVFPYIPA